MGAVGLLRRGRMQAGRRPLSPVDVLRGVGRVLARSDVPCDPLEDSSAGPQAPQEFLPESLRGTFLFGAPRYAARLNRPLPCGMTPLVRQPDRSRSARFPTRCFLARSAKWSARSMNRRARSPCGLSSPSRSSVPAGHVPTARIQGTHDHESRRLLAIPWAAVQQVDDHWPAFVRLDGVFELRRGHTGDRAGNLVEILTGLQAGEQVREPRVEPNDAPVVAREHARRDPSPAKPMRPVTLSWWAPLCQAPNTSAQEPALRASTMCANISGSNCLTDFPFENRSRQRPWTPELVRDASRTPPPLEPLSAPESDDLGGGDVYPLSHPCSAHADSRLPTCPHVQSHVPNRGSGRLRVTAAWRPLMQLLIPLALGLVFLGGIGLL